MKKAQNCIHLSASNPDMPHENDCLQLVVLSSHHAESFWLVSLYVFNDHSARWYVECLRRWKIRLFLDILSAKFCTHTGHIMCFNQMDILRSGFHYAVIPKKFKFIFRLAIMYIYIYIIYRCLTIDT